MQHLEPLRDHLRAAGVADDRHVDLWTAVLTGLTDPQISNDPGGECWGRLLDERRRTPAPMRRLISF